MPDNTQLQPTQPSTPAPVAPAAPPATIPDAASVMQGIIAKHNADNIPIEQTELAPVSPVEPEPAQQNLAPREPEYQPPAAYESPNYRAIESWLIGTMEVDPDGANDLAAAVLNQLPQILLHNRDYVLRVLGLDPETAQRTLDARNAREYAASATLASETDRLFGEYVAKGKLAGLSDLEAVGLAAIAYQQFSRGYWKQGSDWQKAFDGWMGEVKAGYKLGPKRDGFRKMFDDAFRRAAENFKHHKTGATTARYQGLTGSDLMTAMLRDSTAS